MASGTIASIALSFALSIVIARLLGPESLANYATVSVAALVIAQLNDLGLANAFAYYARHRPGSVPTLLRILARHLLFCAVVAVLLVLAAPAVRPSVREALAPPWFSAMVVVFLVGGTAANVLPVIILARGRYAAYVSFTNATTALQLAAVTIVYAVKGPSWRGFIAGVALAQVAIVLVQLAYLRRIGADSREGVTARECYSYGLRIKWAEIMKLLSGRVDLLLVTMLLPRADVGAYAVAISFREFGLMPLRTYTGIFQNLLVDRARAGRHDGDLVIGSLLLQTLVSVALILGAALVFPLALPWLYGRAYANLPLPATILYASTLFLSIAGLCWTVFNMRGRPALTSRIVTVSGVLGPVLVWVLARNAGIVGAATAGLITGAVISVVSLVALMRLCQYSGSDAIRVARRVPDVVRELRLAGAATLRRSAAGAAAGR